jgi:hypothetical protein
MWERKTIDGQCHCGAIAYQAVVDPRRVVLCHCADCQTFSGAPYRTSVSVLIENFTLRGTPSTYLKRGGSGAEIRQAFCGTCGTAIYSTKAVDGTSVNLRLGSVRQRAELPPMAQGFCGSAMPWAMDIRGVHIVPDKD